MAKASIRVVEDAYLNPASWLKYFRLKITNNNILFWEIGEHKHSTILNKIGIWLIYISIYYINHMKLNLCRMDSQILIFKRSHCVALLISSSKVTYF